MLIYYDENGKITNLVYDEHRAYANPDGARIEVDETAQNMPVLLDLFNFIMGPDENPYTVQGGALHKDGLPVTLNADSDRAQVRDEYQNAITTLMQIENAASPTNAQVVAAVKFLAKTLRLLLKFLARYFG